MAAAGIASPPNTTTRFTVVLANGGMEQPVGLLRHPHARIGLSDAGAHIAQLCDAVFAPYLLGHWVREQGVLDLETMPAGAGRVVSDRTASSTCG